MWNASFGTEYKRWGQHFKKRTPCQYSSTVKLFPGSGSTDRVLKDKWKSSPHFINGFITNNFMLIYVPNKMPDLPNDEAFIGGTCLTNVSKLDIKQVSVFVSHQGFRTLLQHGRQPAERTRTNKILG
jgi:hypothetical protein